MFCKFFSSISDNVNSVLQKSSLIESYYYNQEKNRLILTISKKSIGFTSSSFASTEICRLINGFVNGTLILDMANLDSIHSSFIGALINAQQILKNNNSQLLLINLSEKVKYFLKLGNSLNAFIIYDNDNYSSLPNNYFPINLAEETLAYAFN